VRERKRESSCWAPPSFGSTSNWKQSLFLHSSGRLHLTRDYFQKPDILLSTQHKLPLLVVRNIEEESTSFPVKVKPGPVWLPAAGGPVRGSYAAD